jgi:hypothetical protein
MGLPFPKRKAKCLPSANPFNVRHAYLERLVDAQKTEETEQVNQVPTRAIQL